MANQFDNTESGSEVSNVVVGNNPPISMKVVQGIYNEITGRTEKISKTFRSSHMINYQDIEQLNFKAEQLFETFDVISKNCSVTLYHSNDQKEEFSSFQRFSLYNKSALTPCENINIVYDFLIVLPKTHKTQSYKLVVNISSTVAQNMREDDAGVPAFFAFFGDATANFTIEYVDYTVARTFCTAIQEWYDSVDKKDPSKVVKWLQKNSHHSAFIFTVSTMLVVLISTYQTSHFVLPPTPNFTSLFKAAIIVFGLFQVASVLATFVGRECERAIDRMHSGSLLMLTRGDEILKNKLKEKRSRNLGRLTLSFLGFLIINTISAFFTKVIGL